MKSNRRKDVKRLVRRKRVRAKVKGTKSCPRLSVFRSNRGMYVQLINDETGTTIVSASSKEILPGQSKSKESGKTTKKDISFQLGKLIAKRASAKKIKQVVFDRGGYKYHGRVETLAKGAREGGLKF